MSNKLTLTQKEAVELRVKADTTFCKSNYLFLNNHNGFRPGKLHLILGVPGGGKSTLRMTIIYDFIKNNPGKKIFLWLSEESEEDFKYDLSKFSFVGEIIPYLYIYSEVDNPLKGDHVKILEKFVELFLKAQCELYLFDNITTSKIYGNSFDHNEKASTVLKRIINKTKTAGVIFAHTKSDVKRSAAMLIDPNDIRGSKTIVNLSEFLYVLQTFEVAEVINTTLRIVKHRSQTPKDKLFFLAYSNQTGTYFNDVKLPFNKLKELFKQRDKLC